MKMLSRLTLTAQRAKLSNSVEYIFAYQRNPQKKKSSSTTSRRLCNCGKGHICQRSCVGFALWMSGQRCQGSSVNVSVHISRMSLGVDVTAFGFITTVSLRTLQAGTIWPYNGRSLM